MKHTSLPGAAAMGEQIQSFQQESILSDSDPSIIKEESMHTKGESRRRCHTHPATPVKKLPPHLCKMLPDACSETNDLAEKLSKRRHAASQYEDLMGKCNTHTQVTGRAHSHSVFHCSCLHGRHWTVDLGRKGGGMSTEECAHLSELLLLYDTFIAKMTARM